MTTTLQDCLGRITKPLESCATCLRNETNLRCICYQQYELVLISDVGEVDEFGEQGRCYLDEIDRRHKKVSE